jgi:nitroimidazol reductase NimA-like FMN-containing flavoprotein (pyridoxamine 5'-phosphate oxidase superfamily)
MTDNSVDELQLSESERDRFLNRVDTGTLSLATPTDEPPHSVPVSFGYDPVGTTFFFRIADLPPQQKGNMDNQPVTFVTYDDDGEIGSYVSVIAQGSLEETMKDEIALETLEALERVTIPFVDIFGAPPAEIDFSFYRLVPETLTSRK